MKTTCPISQHASSAPDSPAIITRTCIYSYDQLNTMVNNAVATLTAKGIGKNTRVALTDRNSVAYVTVLTALWRMGAVAVPLNCHFPSQYIKTVLEKLDVRRLITSTDSQTSEPPVTSTSNTDETTDTTPLPPPEIDFNNDATIILTSGSTGEEKAVLHTYGNHHYNALGSNQNIRPAPGDRWLLSLPLFHVGGLGILFRSFLAGAAIAIPGKEESLAESIGTYDITHVSLVSTQLLRLLQENPSTASLKALLLGGSAFPPKLLEQAIELKLPIHTTYGLSEMTSQVTTTPPDSPTDKLMTSGTVLPHREILIDDNGEICVRGETLFKGYVEDQRVTLPLDENEFFKTGDLGRLDDDGYLSVLGRKDNMFISGGENIMPEEIETLLNGLPEIKQALVAPLPDETYGFRPAAFIDFTDGAELSKELLLDYLEAQLPRFKIPDVFYEWPRPNDPETLKIKRPDFKELVKNPEDLKELF